MNSNSFSQTTNVSTYKENITKNIVKKRGRSCTRRIKLVTNTEGRIIRDKLSVSYADKAFRREMKQFEKTAGEAAGRGIHDIPMPDFLVDLREGMKLAENNLTMARVSHDAMNAFPPLK